MNDHKALEYLENLDVLSEDYWSEDEDLISSGEGWLFYLHTVRVIETPMKIQEIKMSFSQNKLNRNQYLSGASVDLSTSSDNILPGAGDEQKVADLSVDVPSKRNKELKKNPFL